MTDSRSGGGEEEGIPHSPGDGLQERMPRGDVVKVPLAVALSIAREKGRSRSSRRKIYRNNFSRYLEGVSLLEKYRSGREDAAEKAR